MAGMGIYIAQILSMHGTLTTKIVTCLTVHIGAYKFRQVVRVRDSIDLRSLTWRNNAEEKEEEEEEEGKKRRFYFCKRHLVRSNIFRQWANEVQPSIPPAEK